ncbi:MAG TPA: hypothetical protein PKZ16_02035 [bacterium]|nr:hypothetical protein [bacterium]HPL95848.1 hypothetical protein [bacterium]
MTPSHEQKIILIFNRLQEIFKLTGWQFKTMRRQIDTAGRGVLNLKKSYVLAHTNLKKKSITIDIYTPRHRRPKSLKSILNILAHEIAHNQKPPFLQKWQGRVIARRHYPTFYRQVNKNIKKIKKDDILKQYYF